MNKRERLLASELLTLVYKKARTAGDLGKRLHMTATEVVLLIADLEECDIHILALPSKNQTFYLFEEGET